MWMLGRRQPDVEWLEMPADRAIPAIRSVAGTGLSLRRANVRLGVGSQQQRKQPGADPDQQADDGREQQQLAGGERPSRPTAGGVAP